jgi:hypothetical protein
MCKMLNTVIKNSIESKVIIGEYTYILYIYRRSNGERVLFDKFILLHIWRVGQCHPYIYKKCILSDSTLSPFERRYIGLHNI